MSYVLLYYLNEDSGGTNVSVSVGVLSGTFNLPALSLSTDANVSLGLLSGTYSLQDPTFGSSTSVTVSAGILSGSYSLPSPSVGIGITIGLPVLSGAFLISDGSPSSSQDTSIELGVLSGSYSLPAPSVNTSVVLSLEVLSGSYSLPSGSINTGGNVTVEVGILSAAFNFVPVTLSTGTTVQVGTLSGSFDLEDPALSIGSTIQAGILSGTFSLNGVSVVSDYGVSISLGVLSGTFSIPATSVTASNSDNRPLREKIIEALSYQLGQITEANGYNYDMKEVLSTPKAISQFKNFPVANIFMESEEVLDLLPGGHSIGYLHCRIPVHIDFYLDSYNNPRVARENLLADVEKRLMNNQSLPDSNGDATVSETRLQDNLFFGTNVNSPLIGLSLTLNLYYHQLITDPTRMQ